ncbi:aminotransferase class V-fold PLP-dependent enzyme [Paenibacillus soyae]|uniref:Aminotransferase class V-fold PLP-dependent enzyme n=1 Tax=Paenibacillus soyae TaxID=2969249 RepID=A0A9X2S9J2_9BACL|nr:aminotransferase class V-fold PLP-dependent enzyme [Paenibacillus soyae]MCR2805504.1 aminotransferase class V-fold PLP-dependent enzyme [Paenibacillus soyae]
MERLDRSRKHRSERSFTPDNNEPAGDKPQYALTAEGDAVIRCDIERMLNRLFQRDAGWSLPAVGRREEIMNALLGSLIRPSETVLVPVYGPRGRSIADLCERLGADPVVLEMAEADGFDLAGLENELRRRRPVLVAISHGEPLSGMSRSMEKIGSLCQELDILFVADCTATFGSTLVQAEKWHLDAAIGAPISRMVIPVSYNERALARMRHRSNVELPFLRMIDDWNSLLRENEEAGRLVLRKLRDRLAIMIGRVDGDEAI